MFQNFGVFIAVRLKIDFFRGLERLSADFEIPYDGFNYLEKLPLSKDVERKISDMTNIDQNVVTYFQLGIFY